MQCVLSDEALLQYFRDDVPYGDLTTELLLNPDQPLTIQFSARQSMTLCCVEEAARLFQLKNSATEMRSFSGAKLSTGDIFLTAKGAAADLFAVWKVAQTMIEWASGVATSTSSLVDVAQGVPVVCTRKQNPGTKALSVKAVKAGGGGIHRLGLSESILVFAEHRQFNDLEPKTLLQHLKRRAPEQLAVVEVHSVQDAIEWIKAGVAVLQMDKFTIEQVQQLSAYCFDINSQTLLAAAGGLNQHNVEAYVKAGARLIVTSSPYHAQPQDVQVRFMN